MEDFCNYPFSAKFLLNLYFPDYCQMPDCKYKAWK